MLPNGRTVHLDLAYPSQRVDIEVDHNEWHATPTAVAQDKQRDLGLAILGWERLRFTDHAVRRNLRVCVADVRAVLDLRLARSTSARVRGVRRGGSANFPRSRPAVGASAESSQRAARPRRLDAGPRTPAL